MIKRFWHGDTTPDAARCVLKRLDETSQRNELCDSRSYGWCGKEMINA